METQTSATKYNPGLTSDLERSVLYYPGTEPFIDSLIDGGVKAAERIVARITGSVGESDACETIDSAEDHIYLKVVSGALSGLISLSKESGRQTTPNDWGEVLKCEAWYRHENSISESVNAVSPLLNRTMTRSKHRMTIGAVQNWGRRLLAD